MILVPKLKYERLLQKSDRVEERVKRDPVTQEINLNSNDAEQQHHTDADLTDKSKPLQTGTGYVSIKRQVGKPPGIRIQRKKKKNIPWLTY